MTQQHPNPKITQEHLNRKAIVYLRQSSQKQVLKNTESQRLQYGLAQRARELGWQQVEIIDQDLGSSAAIGAATRVGFERIIASVAVGEVGIIFSLELSRLLRTDKDWCHLLEVCQIFGVLIGDGENVYDLNLMDDQLVLGIKGTLSVVELKVLKQRLLKGQEEKARRGELKRLLPPGYVHDGVGKVVKDANQRIQEAISLVFKKFQQIQSIRQTFLWFHAQQIALPVNNYEGGQCRIIWRLPTQSFVGELLRNPFFAGAYVYGRRTTRVSLVGGKLRKRLEKLSKPHKCRVLIRDHHEGYISWETFEEHLRLMDNNNLKLGGDEAAGAVRSGQGLLVGLLRCGRCGRKLSVRYWGKSGTAARYVCSGDYYSGGHYCLAFGGSTVDRRMVKELLTVLTPLGVRASVKAAEKLNSADNERQQAFERQHQQLEYEARHAFEQYNQVDPRNRLVAVELERRWNLKLEELEQVKKALVTNAEQRPPLTEEDREKVMELGEKFQQVWESEHCPVELKKRIVRTVMEEAIVNIDAARKKLDFTIHWKGGVHTRMEMDKPPSGAGQKTAVEDLEIIRRMAVRYGDNEIARVLTKLDRRTGKGKRWNEERVADARHRHSISGRAKTVSDPEIVSKGEAAKYCRVSHLIIGRLVASGILPMEQIVPWATWEIKRADLDAEAVRMALDRLRKTGKLGTGGDVSENQTVLFQQ